MNKEVPLKERIEKLYESGYVNEFNYLESQLQEARYLVTILHKQTEEKDKEIERLKQEKENLTNIVANKIIEDYDIDTPLKNQLNEERIKYINLSAVCNDYKSRNEKAIEKIESVRVIGLKDGKTLISTLLNDVLDILEGVDKE